MYCSLAFICHTLKKIECGRNCFIFCFETNILCFCFLFITESELCVLRLILDKDSKGSFSSCGTFSVSSSLLSDALPHRSQPRWPPSSPLFSIQILPECSWAPLPAVAAWRPPEGRERRSHQVGVCAHLHARNLALEPPHCLLFRVWEQFPILFSFLIPNGRWASRHCSSYRCRKGNPLQGPRVGSHVLTKQETWLEGRPGGQQQGEEAPGALCTTWPAVSGFMVMGLVSRLSLAKHSDSGFVSCILFSFLITSYYCWGSPDTLYLFGSRNHVLF